MNLRRNIALAIGTVAILSGMVPAFAQAEFDVEVADVPEVMEVVDAPDVFIAAEGIAGPEIEVAALPPEAAVRIARGGPGQCGPGGGGRGCGFLDGPLAITDEQSERLYQLRNSVSDRIGPKMLENRTLQRQMRDLMSQPQIDHAKVAALQAKIVENKSAVEGIKLAGMLDAAEVLTPEQRKAIHQRMIKGGGFRGKGGFSHGMRRGHGGPGFRKG